jgi:protein-S-isoprenylcysteine O-methyltransferase Ste14
MRRQELDEADLGDVFAEVVESAKELSRAEIALARQEGERNLAAFRRAAALAGVAVMACSVSAAVSIAALAMHFGSPLLAVCVGAGAGVFGLTLAALARRAMPGAVLERTRIRAGHTLRTMEEDL